MPVQSWSKIFKFFWRLKMDPAFVIGLLIDNPIPVFWDWFVESLKNCINAVYVVLINLARDNQVIIDNLYTIPSTTFFMAFFHIEGAAEIPNSNLYWHNPLCVLMVSKLQSDCLTGMWRKASDTSVSLEVIPLPI